MPDVSVAVIHVARTELTFDCLESLHDDDGRRSSVEIVVLDNASGDRIHGILADRFPDVRCLVQPWRAGFGANNNAIAGASSGRYLFVLNADTRVPPGTVDVLVEHLDANPVAAVAGPLIRGFDGAHQLSGWRFISVPAQLAWALTLGRFGAARGTAVRPVGVVSGCAMLVRRDAFDRVGGFDEGYFMYVEEADLARRLDREGLERHYVPRAEVLHLGQGSTGGATERQVNEFWRSLDRYLGAYHAPPAARAIRWLTGIGYLLGLLAALVARALPSAIRPAAARAANPRAYRLHVRNAFTGRRDPGLRELAETWNAEHYSGR